VQHAVSKSATALTKIGLADHNFLIPYRKHEEWISMSKDKSGIARRRRAKRRTKLKKKYVKPDQRLRRRMVRGQRGGRRK
jgi:hypothetical protein